MKVFFLNARQRDFIMWPPDICVIIIQYAKQYVANEVAIWNTLEWNLTFYTHYSIICFHLSGWVTEQNFLKAVCFLFEDIEKNCWHISKSSWSQLSQYQISKSLKKNDVAAVTKTAFSDYNPEMTS